MSSRWGVAVLSGIILVHLACGQAAGQMNRRGFSSRGVNQMGSRGSVRSPVITGARSTYNSRFGAARGPLGFNYLPTGGFYLDLSTPFYYPGESMPQGESGESGAQGESTASGTRPNIRPRLDITDRNAINSITLLTSLRQSVLGQIAATAEKPFSPEWFAAHPNVTPIKVTGGDPWRRADWAQASQLVGIHHDPYRYDFRPDRMGLIYVHRNESREARAVDARGPAMELAKTAESLTDESPALSLGVFAAVPPVDEPVTQLVHLAVSKSGAVSGHQYDFRTDSMAPLQGAVDPSSQRVAWQVGNDYAEAGLKNLTEDVSRFILFRADGWTQPWILMRIVEEQ